ncbi:TIGR03790 family protein [Aeoliella mucimassa]|uniref:TIGR03790 family protein n=1 Tax=Aeoliella mucimassa TaxID=2527972 RepID=A0A518AWH5_9BACT|nr:TIGR03790 family protein [Aeoliella mucimassa]QDU59089.1 hypothetical protein Pan181_53300 [Aeoliella mucimassa]
MRLLNACLFLALLMAVVCSSRSQAAGGPESIMLVVNSHSDSSMAIANHYIRLRKIPPRNVMYLDWQGDTTKISGTEFREQILVPILKEIDQRKLSRQVEYVVYSSDFPYRIDFREEFKDNKPPAPFNSQASLTGATYLWVYVQQNQPGMVMPSVNWYVPPEARKNQAKCTTCGKVVTRGFEARTYWSKEGEPTTDREKGQMYFISTMLGVTVDRGNTVEEVCNYLSRAKAADATQPKGTFYFMKNSDIRSSTRHGCFAETVAQLKAEGAQAVIEDGKVPTNAKDVLGIMAGTAGFKVDSSVSIAPGAICEHFTSFGGQFDAISQTKLSAWLQAGAAGSSGTVREPYAVQAKFPLPNMHLHYYRGASLGEAYYQSIPGPYQLLIVGDPLCQPWAKPPEVEVAGIEPGQTVRGQFPLQVKVTPQPGTQVEQYQLFIDGLLLAQVPKAVTVPVDVTKMGHGWHELRVVASTSDEIGFRGRDVVPFYVAASEESPEEPGESGADSAESSPEQGNSPPIQLQVSPSPLVPADSILKVRVIGPADSPGFAILQNYRQVGYVEGSNGEVEIDTKLLGRGPVSLVAQESASPEAPLETPEAAPRSAPYWLLIR